MTRITPSEAFVKTPAAHGVTHVFGIVGSAYMDTPDIFKPAGKKMGHAGAIVSGGSGTYASKCAALEAACVVVLDTPSDVGAAATTALETCRGEAV
jgi:succinyl-CoA synthetase alpha subunit